MPSNDNFRTCICKHITPLDTCWAILSSFFGPAWVISSNSDHFCRASLGHVEQFWTVFGNTIWHCRPWTVFKMSQVRLLWDILLWLKKVADVNPTDLDPKTRSAIRVWYGFQYVFYTWKIRILQNPKTLETMFFSDKNYQKITGRNLETSWKTMTQDSA